MNPRFYNPRFYSCLAIIALTFIKTQIDRRFGDTRPDQELTALLPCVYYTSQAPFVMREGASHCVDPVSDIEYSNVPGTIACTGREIL